ncbi:mitochondrial inheritance component mdm12 [Diplodia corticola]|uniref:Mitochondrial distribution and morphology protein 12 n=1 Tax=Diplodia corticola TaxID=236234 RepID=A0A1J9S1L1_9PEZI|nr:mitochondrial inheritance component mdm12 [Diplodia corticola]OJD34471.1 mitochondrial inheritance component mdm12 [Diplodia corticola]
MSIDIHWDTLIGGPDGQASAEAVRSFIHERFQQVTLPRFIRSVKVHSFDFGSVAPEIEIKDICDPLPDFYEEEEEEEDEDNDDEDDGGDDDDVAPDNGTTDPPMTEAAGGDAAKALRERKQRPRDEKAQDEPRWNHARPPPVDPRLTGLRSGLALGEQLGNSLSREPTPGIPGGTSNMSYFHLPLGAGLSGTTTPFAAVAGAQFQNGWHDYHHADRPHTPRDHSASISSNTPSTADLDSRPQSQHDRKSSSDVNEHPKQRRDSDKSSPSPTTRLQEASPEDLQVVAHVRYSGDIKMVLTAEILLDYPMPSFVGIPLKLTVTGLTFDGVAILAYIKKRAHFCFLSPEDAEALIGAEAKQDSLADDHASANQRAQRTAPGGLFEEIKVESEIGQKEQGKQVLKNVGKVEKFILDQVRRIFEDEFVYPSFWTFLV